LRNKEYTIAFKNPIEHGQKLAAIAHNFNNNNRSYPPMRALFESLNIAKQFIHFSTYGLSHIIFGALKLKAQTIPIRGIAANVHSNFIKEIKNCNPEAPNLEIKVFEQNQRGQDWDDIPHQKLIVIDGLMAFKGAANMTNSGWRKAAKGRDHIEIVTNIQEVVMLHNKLFSPIWAEFNDDAEITMWMQKSVPF
jgi:phosphatidylserine/phosphatidylglycerophosphate/cardiolipin synthase-like enzyme